MTSVEQARQLLHHLKLRLDALLGIVITGLVFGFVLAQLVHPTGHGAVTGWYPYPFLDAHTHGYAIAVRNTGAVVVLGVVIALVLKALDGRLPAIRR
jgi:hypothetical protein